MKEGCEKRALFGVKESMTTPTLHGNFFEETNDHER